MPFLIPLGFSGGDNPDYGLLLPEAVAYDQHPELEADAEHKESVLVLGMVRVKESDGVLVQEHGLRLFKRDPMLAAVLPVLLLVPFETKLIHIYSVCIEASQSRSPDVPFTAEALRGKNGWPLAPTHR